MQNNNLAAYLFHQGMSTRAWEYLGHHREGDLTVFRVWAPGAERVDLVADFNGWSEGVDPFARITEQGIWEASVETRRAAPGSHYKFKLTRNGVSHLKADPFAFAGQAREQTASILRDSEYRWRDDAYLLARKKHLTADRTDALPMPINIYEMHLGSWRTRDGRPTADGDAELTYREIAQELVPYLKKMGYTHVELMPVTEYPCDGSWGYQACSYYAPTARYGTPDDFKYFVDELHCAGIGVILDWVPARFPADEHGLSEFDGTPLYEYPEQDCTQGRGIRRFHVGRGEVQSFLISSAMFWLEEYHADGLHFDAAGGMLYPDSGKAPDGGTERNEAIAFFQKLNQTVRKSFPDVMLIADGDAACDQELGFHLKRNTAWSEALFGHLQTDARLRQGNRHKLTFAFGERCILPVSHEGTVNGKQSLISKIASDYENKFPTVRTFLTYMMTAPGKKLLFMGSEYGQFQEWDHEKQLEWFLVNYDSHDRLQYFVSRLNHFYLQHKELWEQDFSRDGCRQLSPDGASATVSYQRCDREGNGLVIAVNFSGTCEASSLAVGDSDYEVAFSTDEAQFGGTDTVKRGAVCQSTAGKIQIDLQPLSAVILKPIKRKERHNV